MSIEYAIIVKNKTRLESLIERFNTKAQAKFYIESMGGSISDYELENEQFHAALNSVQQLLSKVIKYKIIDRSFLPSYLFSAKNVIIAIGQDGLIANTAKYAKGVPIIGVNPDPSRYDGVLLPFNPADFIHGVEKVVSNQFHARTMHFAEAKLNDGQRLLAFNDLFIGASSHVSARYKIAFGQNAEEHSSSGIIVSTAAGATGWLSSIFNMAYGINNAFGNGFEFKKPIVNDNELLFTVREPFKSVRTQIDLCTGLINQKFKLTIESLMPSNGIIFSDGIEADFLNFNSGAIATIGIAHETANLVFSPQSH